MNKEMKLLETAMDGNTAAFEQIVKQYQSLVCAITFSGTGRVDISEELAQETFLIAWKNLRQLRDLSGFRPWLCTIARNMLNNYYRKRKTVPLESADIADLSDQSPTPFDRLVTQEEHVMLEQALLQIPAEYREPLVMYYRQEKSVRQVAVGLGLNESTVQTRLHRARQMLREEIAARLERTIERTAPNDTFTKAVMLAVGGAVVGLSASASAASVTANTAGTSATGGIAAVMSTVTAKLITTAAVVVVGVGAVFAYMNLTQSDQPHVEPAIPARSTSDDLVANSEPVNFISPAIPAEIQPDITPTLIPEPPQIEIPDSFKPIIPKPIEYVHAFLKEGGDEGEIWVKGDNLWRINMGDIEKICDGQKVMILDHRNKQVSYVRGALKQPEAILEALMFPEMVSKNFNPALEEAVVNFEGQSCLVRINTTKESDVGEAVYDVCDPNSNELLGTVWIHAQTGRLNYLVATEDQGGFVGEWYYEPIDESMFSLQVPDNYELDQGNFISGIVTDADFYPVTDATLYVTGLFEGPTQKIITQTNEDGLFEYELKFGREDWGIEFPVVIRAVSPSHPDMAAWTCILDPEMEVEKWPEWMPPIDPEVVVTKLKPRNDSVICKSIQGLLLVLEPAGSISGIVTDRQGVPVQNAKVNANLHISLYVHNGETGRVDTNGFQISAKTDATGFYTIPGVPSLQGHASSNGNQSKSCYVATSANGFSPMSQYIQNADNSGNSDVTFTEEKVCDFVLSRNNLVIKGRVIDNYGNPLAHYDGVFYMEKGNKMWYPSARLDAEGRFIIPRAPRAETIVLKKSTSDDSHDWLMDNETKKLEFVAYPEKEFEFTIPADVNEFDVGDLVLTYPDITAEIYVVDYEGNPISYVECAFEQIGYKELLKDRYWKVTDEKEGKCIIENLPRAESGGANRAFRPIALRPYEKAPRKYQKIFEQYPNLTYYHLKYPGDYKHYIFELVLPRNDHRDDYRMRIFSPEGVLLLEEH